MRIALISDIHANLPALEAVLAAIDSDATIDVVYHLGDLVGDQRNAHAVPPFGVTAS